MNKINSSYNTLGTLRLSQPTFWEFVSVGWLSFTKALFRIRNPYYPRRLGWPRAAYPAKKSMISNLDNPNPVKDIVLDVS